ncbi:2-C-methyl-D-erythritol 2,4-cyclodiphosphate synthase [Varibaculum cambriense]|uniref:2-C-methyl-D-erythritol 2,4-cyclodiphosphate synthase n=1 Tax=Varibaculum cambriense TaxID=184870 RepID=UPI00290CA446|nr:2-C-methyl-D-erythritol 2,4-cyclodiphosphate synthase [Varibaculum cambriense]MDU3275074.1 2-C-methyl-D-erythritol 2,4-cyclodiphosphate synthase [Varibaculum cambriense]
MNNSHTPDCSAISDGDPQNAKPISASYLLPRVGIGSDVHAFADPKDPGSAARPCMVAGLSWPGETPLKGHSDADVAAHALCDAILSAAGQGDLGTHFGTDRPEWKGASGTQLLVATMETINQAGWALGNAAVQVIANRPRMGQRYQQARAVLEEAVGAPVSISATTSDKLGFTGRGEGAAAIATALVYPLSNPNSARGANQ